jgi:NADH-quinone oxidoreductase subunit F
MSQKILLDKINIPGIKPTKYTVKTGLCSVEKPENINTRRSSRRKVKTRMRVWWEQVPAGMKWSFIDKKSENQHHLVCNADESEPGTFKDRYLMEFIPHLLIEGMITPVMHKVQTIHIYIRGEYMWVYKILERAINEAKAAGFLGKNILGSGYDLELYVHCGAGATFVVKKLH